MATSKPNGGVMAKNPSLQWEVLSSIPTPPKGPLPLVLPGVWIERFLHAPRISQVMRHGHLSLQKIRGHFKHKYLFSNSYTFCSFCCLSKGLVIVTCSQIQAFFLYILMGLPLESPFHYSFNYIFPSLNTNQPIAPIIFLCIVSFLLPYTTPFNAI